MSQTRKETAWKKSRTFGDVKGGRMWPKRANKIFNRQHNFQIPSENDDVPLFIEDNSSRDFFFPISINDIKGLLSQLPEDHTKNITHIWMRRMSLKEYKKVEMLRVDICTSFF